MSIQTNESHSQIVNPNLLINPDFKINQRGQTTYTENDRYGFDRWMVQCSVNNEAGYICRTGNVVSISKILSSAYFNIWQPIDLTEFNNIEGDTILTLSCFVEDYNGKVELRSIQLNSGEGLYHDHSNWIKEFRKQITKTGIQTLQITIDSDITTYPHLFLGLTMDTLTECSDVKIKWMKVEVGTVATPFVSPEHSLELLKCKRYYQRIGQGLTVYTRSEVSLLYYGRFSVEMRAVPTITLLNISFFVYARDTGIGYEYQTTSGYVISFFSTTKDIRFIEIAGFDGLVPGLICHSNNEEDMFAFDAEIY